MGLWASEACIALILITIHVVFVLLKYTRRKLDGTSLPLPPGPVGLPLIGNFLYFIGPLRRNPHRGLACLAEAYGPIVSFRPGTAKNFVLVSSPEAAREALVANDAGLTARPVADNARALAHSAGSVFVLPGSDPLWKKHRITIGARFSGRSLNVTRPMRDRNARQIAEHFRACSSREVSVGEALMSTALNSVSNVLFSKDVVDAHALGEAHVFKELVVKLTADTAKPNISDAFPFLAPLDLLGSRRSFSRTLDKFYKLLNAEFVEPRLATGEKHDDVLDDILAQYAKSQLTHSDITKFLTDMFVAGSDTSALTVQWAMAQLLRHPDKMQKVHTELAANLGSKEFVEESDLVQLPYIKAVVKETLRLHPVTPLIPREVVSDDMCLGGFHIPIGTSVFLNVWAIGRDPASWPQPEEFMPERFLGDRAVDYRGSDFSFKPFGAGRRVCPGLDISARFVPHLLASILHKIDWRLPNGMAPEDVDLSDNHRTNLDLATPLRAIPMFIA
ncbi:hypothetical protein PR202_ga31545 [Eleusine coracana subsp. coracana]|uniref:Uncharacterized protein n=1 Tax=Eleusine coracana subsp. coracana TaxID=191504 RepID=A0AAV5DS58_ELECO|nr:hypothetical protein QOZ80_6BG0490590 [Eleusine coracana subsp. coracana]GJN13201.1 hypothetical protein PR202_ga31545 [Eleusine coracana subsp. coracana]